MYITLETDYAIRIVDTLTKSRVRLNAQCISERNDVTIRFALKILSKLVKHGIAVSYKGASGGYEIQKPASEISINDILEAIEGPYMLSRCLSDSYNCHRNAEEEKCVYHLFFDEISEEIVQKLKAATMDKFVKR